MTKPGSRLYASNPLWLGGPDAGQPSKVPASAGALAEGVYGNIRPAPQLWNYEWWSITSMLRNAAAHRVLNPEPADLAAAIALPWVGGPADGCHDGPAMMDTILTGSNVPAPFNLEEAIGAGCVGWTAAVAAAPALQTYPRVAVHATNSSRGAVLNAGLALGVDVIASVGYGAWAAWPGGTPGAGTWCSIARSAQAWVVGASVGPGAGQWVQYAATTAAAFAVPGVAPMFATPVTCLRASNHLAGDVWPNDPGNDVFLALSAGWRSVGTPNGQSWSAVALHLLPAAPLDLAYCKASTKWIAPLGDGTISYSTDNGATWTNQAIGTTIAVPIASRIACDGFGDWMLCLTDGATVECWASYDDGVTWTMVFANSVPLAPLIVGSVAVWYGGGRFHVYTGDGAGLHVLWLSPRFGE